MDKVDPGRNREESGRLSSLSWFQSEGRTIYVRPRSWNQAGGAGGGAGRPEPEAPEEAATATAGRPAGPSTLAALAGELLRDRDRSRDMAVLASLAQHHYLSTGHIEALFFTYTRGAQRRMHKLERWGLVTRWHQMEPPEDSVGGWRRRKDLFLLTARGASVLARYQRTDAGPLIRRAFHAFHYALHIDHALGVNDFFASLATANRELGDQGLYHWVGDDGTRRSFQDRGADLAPDGWGRYLLPDSEVTFYLEWDQGTEALPRLRAKARAAQNAGARHVLWVAPWPAREQTIRAALARDGGDAPGSFLTSHARLLREHGPLGEIWQRVGESRRQRLTGLSGQPRSALDVSGCLGKPGWWLRRSGGTEGA